MCQVIKLLTSNHSSILCVVPKVFILLAHAAKEFQEKGVLIF